MELMKKVEKYAKKYGILYSVLPDADRKNGKTEIIFHTEAVPRANMLLQKLSGGRIATFDDYLKNGDEKQLNKLMEFLKNQKKGNEMSPSPESARANMLMDGLIEKVGMYAMEKKTINVDAVKENFSINHEQAEIALGGFYSYNGMSFYEVMGKNFHYMFGNRALTYVSTEGEPAIKAYELEQANAAKAKGKMFGASGKADVSVSDEIDTDKKKNSQAEFEASKKKMMRMLIICMIFIVLLVGVAVAYKLGYLAPLINDC